MATLSLTITSGLSVCLANENNAAHTGQRLCPQWAQALQKDEQEYITIKNFYTMKTKGIRVNKSGRLRVSAKLWKRSIAKMAKETAHGKRATSGGRKLPDRCSHVRRMVEVLKDRYEIRFNSVTSCTEYRAKGSGAAFAALDIRTIRRITLEVQVEGMAVSINDVRNYLESDIVDCFDPIEGFLKKCRGKWDGKDRIGMLAAAVAAGDGKWDRRFHTWFLGMVAQWTGKTGAIYGNSNVPLLISAQGFNKSTFCRRLLPPELRWGYCDSMQLQEKRQVLRAMSELLLINLDEFNQISPKVQQGFLKNLIQLPALKLKRPYGSHVEQFPRLASFIATSNLTDILADPSGNRRFIGVELTGPVDVSVRPNYQQLYAQALAALDNREKSYFDDAQVKQIMRSNADFELVQPEEQYFNIYYEIVADAEEGEWLSAAEIFDWLKRQVGSSLRIGSMIGFGRRLANMPELKRKRFADGMKYLVRKRQ